MNQLIKLLLIILLISEPLLAQERGKLKPTATGTVIETIDIHYPGGSGWHIIHKEAPKKFLKEASLRRTDACLKCHVKDEYKIFDPHKQRNVKGEIMGEKCLYCHVEKPVDVLDIPYTSEWRWHVVHKETPKRLLKELPFQSVCFKCHAKVEKVATFKEIKIIKNSTILCQGCHGSFPSHPANANHMLKPSAKLLAMMKEGEKEFDIIFPLDYEKKVTCITCHNPHERGVVPAGIIGAEGAGEKSELRLPVEKDQICLACHKDKIVSK